MKGDVGRKIVSVEILHASPSVELTHVRDLFREYAEGLGISPCFEGFDKELAELPGDYAPPGGRLLIARYDEQMAGCVALRNVSDGISEMKRLFVRPSFRGKGIGRELAAMVIGEARIIGYRRIRLETLPVMMEAVPLYLSLGFGFIDPYRKSHAEGALYMELRLDSESRVE